MAPIATPQTASEGSPKATTSRRHRGESRASRAANAATTATASDGYAKTASPWQRPATTSHQELDRGASDRYPSMHPAVKSPLPRVL